MHIGYESDTGHVYEGAVQPMFAVVPAPLLTHAILVEGPGDLEAVPRGIEQDPHRWVFREESFDPVTRVRRGRLYEPTTHSQPDACMTRGHPANLVVAHIPGAHLQRRLCRYQPCVRLLMKSRAGVGLTLALGQGESWSTWRIVQVERVIGGDVLVTLKALSAFGVLPDLNVDAIEPDHREPVSRAIDRVLDSAFREGPISVIDQCRNAAVVLLGRWLATRVGGARSLELELGKLISLNAAAGVAEMINRLHPRGKANEQEPKGLRLPVEEDAEAAVHAIGFIMREIGWAS
jgi:hypothetical protein